MTRSTHEQLTEWRVWHGAVVLVLFYLATVIPASGKWPWYFVAPFALYAVAWLVWPAWRRTCAWAKCGRFDRLSLFAGLGIAAVTTVILLAFDRCTQPDVTELHARLGFERFGHPWLGGIVFSLLNAAFEEAIFRGALFDAVEARFEKVSAVLLTALVFGAAHMRGYPPDFAGTVLAGLYGIALGWLRVRTGGLALPILVHIGADATIAFILLGRPSA